MNKTEIEWCDMTWNPVTGCLHGCEYCYARGIARRFSGEDKDHYYFNVTEFDLFSTRNDRRNENLLKIDLHEPIYTESSKGDMMVCAHPFGFTPTFHCYRLNEPAKVKTPKNIFVGSMADMFGDWVSDEWIAEVFKACEAAPQHRYLFLTKNPKRYFNLKNIFIAPPGKYDNWYLGTTIVKGNTFFPSSNGINTFFSIEPILERIKKIDLTSIEWVIIGAEIGNRKNKIIPKREWIADIVDACRDAKVPLFMKNSLAKYGELANVQKIL
jgi:protein gp37